jgi:hypothetical protein
MPQMMRKAIQRIPESTAETTERVLSEPVRRCIASGQVLEKDALLRFVVAPDGEVVHDIQAKLPGRGMWVRNNKADLERVLKKGLFSRSAKRAVTVSDSLLEKVEAALVKRCLDDLGLARRSGRIVTGFAKVEASLRSGKAALLIAARDGAEDGREKLRCLAPSLPLVELFTCEELSRALGLENVIHASLPRSGLHEKFLVDISKLAGFRSIDNEGERTGSE